MKFTIFLVVLAWLCLVIGLYFWNKYYFGKEKDFCEWAEYCPKILGVYYRTECDSVAIISKYARPSKYCPYCGKQIKIKSENVPVVEKEKES